VRDDPAAVTDADWTEMMDRTLFSAVRSCREAVPHMVKRGQGAIVNISSVSGSLPDAAVIDYCAAKAALNSYSKALSVWLAPQGVRVNVISPGPVRTPFWTQLGGLAEQYGQALGVSPEAAMEQFAQTSVPLQRFGTPEEVARTVSFILSDDAGFTTGADYRVDGGMTPM
jgi:NAD(P)-dependent dehydrogenase (short-subunit alcohol dehydrogenase family)